MKNMLFQLNHLLVFIFFLPTLLSGQSTNNLRPGNDFFNKSVKVRKIAGKVEDTFGFAFINPENLVFVGKTRPSFFANAESKRANSFFRLFLFDQSTEIVKRLEVD